MPSHHVQRMVRHVVQKAGEVVLSKLSEHRVDIWYIRNLYTQVPSHDRVSSVEKWYKDAKRRGSTVVCQRGWGTIKKTGGRRARDPHVQASRTDVSKHRDVTRRFRQDGLCK